MMHFHVVALALTLLASSAVAVPPCGSRSDLFYPPGDKAAKTCNQIAGRLKGTIILVDLAAYEDSGPFCHPPYDGTVPSECCAMCRATKDCGGWSLCNKDAGCPDKCAALQTTYYKNTTTTNPYNTVRTGKFGPFRGCIPNAKKQPSDRFLLGTCTLWSTKGLAVLPASQGSGWVSGILTGPAQPGCPKEVADDWCKRCSAPKYSAATKTKCYNCFATQVKASGFQAVISDPPCAACANIATGKIQDQCFACLASTAGAKKEPPCARCVSLALYSGAAAATKCFECLANPAVPATTTGPYGTPVTRADLCADCANIPKELPASKTCFGCISGGAGSPAVPVANRGQCQPCANQYSGASAPACLACVAKAKTPAVAASCVSCTLPPLAQQPACYKCEAQVPVWAARYCARADPANKFYDAFVKALAKTKLEGQAAGIVDCYDSAGYRNDPDLAAKFAKCLACAVGVPTGKGEDGYASRFCSSCWLPNYPDKKGCPLCWQKGVGGEICQKCILIKDGPLACCGSC